MWNQYPRLQLQRDSFFSLNGEWLLNDQKIMIPFPPQSKLSQYHGDIDHQLHYQKSFQLPSSFIKDKVLLHFGAIDQLAIIYINHHKIGEHQGGYLPFSFDITNDIQDSNLLEVFVVDDLSHDYPYGKQRKNHGGMWYTPVSGIWQSIWIESVSYDFIEDLKITPTLSSIHLDVKTKAQEYEVIVDNQIYIFHEKSVDISIENAHLWTPADPYLYTLIIKTKNDQVKSYFALRTIQIKNHQLLLNEKPLFLNGVLDQGYFHDGLFIPQDPIEYQKDILRMKELGMNTLRKHIKIEPDIFYYYCDVYGMLVVQDMVNNGNYHWLRDTALPNIGLKYKKDTLFINQKRKDIFQNHMLATLDTLYNHPCIIIYTIFNEGWGQVCSDEMYQKCHIKDPSRLYDSTSGWFHQKESDFDSQHVYFRNKVLKKKNKPLLLSECGGYIRVIPEHTFTQKKYGYGQTDSEESLTEKIIQMYEEMVIPSLDNGLCGCIYTQLSDIEDEVNGLYTYDRKVCKVNPQKLQQINQKVLKMYNQK